MPYLQRALGNDVRTTLLAMLGAVFGVMLIACANVMSLQLARAAERVKEIAVRTALGASRGRIVRQILLEGLVLSATGALIGLAISAAGIMLFNRAIADTNPPFWIDIRIDGTVLLFVTTIAVVAAIASSLVPALRATKLNLNAVLKDEGRANTGIRMGQFSRWLVVGEVFLSCCLLVVSGLLIKSVVTISRIAYPYATTDIFVANVWIEDLKHPKDPDVIRIASALDERWSAVPGVRQSAIASSTPAQAGSSVVVPEGRTYASDNARPSARRVNVSSTFFDVLRVKLMRGRLFTRADTTGAPLVVVVDDAFAAKHYPGEDAIGDASRSAATPTRNFGPSSASCRRLSVAQQNGETPDMIYVPFEQWPVRGVTVLAQTSGIPTALTAGMRSATALVDEDMAACQQQVARRHARGATVGDLGVRVALHVVRRRGAGAGRRGSLRRDVVHGSPPDAGDRRADGAWRRPRVDRAWCCGRALARRPRRGAGPRAGLLPGGRDEGAVLRRHA